MLDRCHLYFPSAILAGVEKYRDSNGQHPKHLVVFRDGVNAGQLETAHQEAIRLHEVIRASPGLQLTTVTFAIVQKRHNIKLFWVKVSIFPISTEALRDQLRLKVPLRDNF